MIDDFNIALFQPGQKSGPQVACCVVIRQVYPHGCKFRRSAPNPNAHSAVNSHEFLWVTQTKKNLQN